MAAASPEESASCLSRLAFTWLSPLLDIGKDRPLEFADLPPLSADTRARGLAEQFAEHWRAQLALRPAAPSLVAAFEPMYARDFVFCGALKLVADALTLLTPVLLAWLITFIADSQPTISAVSAPAPPLYAGVLIAVGMLLATLGTTVISNWYFRVMMNMGLNVRSVLITAMYRKALRLSPAARADMSTGQIINMVSTDASRLDVMMGFVHYLWSSVLQIIALLALLIYAMGPSALAGVAVVLVLTPLQSKFMTMAESLRGDIAKLTDTRVKIMNEILTGIRVLKVYAWEDSFMAKLFGVREQEMNFVIKSSYLKAVYNTILMVCPTLMSVVSFITLGAASPSQLTAQNVFSSLVYFNLLRTPLMVLPMTLGMFFESKVAVARITAFLLAPELDSQPERLAACDAAAGNQQDQECAIEITNASFRWEAVASQSNRAEAASVAGPSIGTASGGALAGASWHANPLASTGTTDASARADVLSNVSLSLPRGVLCAVIGAVGSGKSTLLSGLLGELKRSAGAVRLRGRVGFCPQQAWIQNASLRDNVLFGAAFDRRRYDRAIEQCALTRDLDVLLDGDLTEIGEKGINLSGGQKARVNLARAVYYDADIVLLDDPLSAVDAHVSKFLFEQCICGALKGKTRVLVTHQLQYVQTGAFDHVVVLNDGGICEQGTYAELMARQGELHRLMHAMSANASDVGPTATVAAASEEAAIGSNDSSASSASASTDDSHVASAALSSATAASAETKPIVNGDDILNASAASAAAITTEPAKPKKTAALMTAEERQTGSVSFEIYLYYLTSLASALLPVLIAVSISASQGIKVVSDWWLSAWTGNLYAQSVTFYLVVYGALGVGQVVLTLIATLCLAFVSQRAALFMHDRAFRNLMRAPLSFFDTTPIGRILNRFSRDQDIIDSTLPDTLRTTLTMLVQSLFTLALIAIVSPWFIVPFLPILVLYYRTQLYYRNCSREIKRLDAIARSPLYSHFGETLTGLSTIRAYAEQERFIAGNESKLDQNNQAYYTQLQSQRWLQLRLELSGALIVGSAALIMVLAAKSTSPSLAGLAVSYALQVTGMLNWFIRQTVDLENNFNSVERTKFYTDQLPQERAARVEGAAPSKGQWPTSGAIAIRDLSMRYREGLPLVLQNVSLDVRGGEKVGVVGRTGAGKSSLMVGLFRLVEAAGGSIAIDGVDISAIGLTDLRERIAIIPQDPVLYSGTVRANLDPFASASDAELWHALERAHLRRAIEALDGGLDAIVAENGDNFSVGQRCQMCLARALLRRAKILICDEATSAIDMETDAQIQTTIRADFADCTILTIAHRLNTIVDYDRVLVLDAGRVLEFDTPAALLRRPQGAFASMVDETGAQSAQLLRAIAFEKETQTVAAAAATV